MREKPRKINKNGRDNDKKDVLLLCQYYRPEGKATAVLAGETMEALAESGLTVDVICGCPQTPARKSPRPARREYVSGVYVRRLRYLSFKNKNALARLLNYFSFYFRCLAKSFTFKNYRAVVSYSNPPMVTDLLNIASRVFRCRTVFIVHDAYPEIAIKTGNCAENGLMASAMRRINKRLLKNLDKVVCLSEEMREFFVNERHFPRERVEVIPNWHRDLCAGHAAPGDGVFTCGYFGNMGVCQDMETPVDGILAMQGDADVRFILAGDGAKHGYVKESLKDASNAKVCDFLADEALGDALSECGCLVVSLCEGLAGYCAPSKYYSYLMAGKPLIVISDGRDMAAEVEEYCCGYVVKNGDVKGFCEAVKKLAGDRGLASSMGQNARRCYLENYTGAESKAKYVELFKSLPDKR